MFEDAMPHDATVLRDVLDQHGVTVKALSLASSLDASTIYRYLSGEKTVPSHILKTVFEVTLDPRLVQLITGRIACVINMTSTVFTAERPSRMPPVSQLLPEACAAVKASADALPYMGKILADGRIDQTDRAAVDHFKKHAADAQRLLSLLTAALEAHLATGAGA